MQGACSCLCLSQKRSRRSKRFIDDQEMALVLITNLPSLFNRWRINKRIYYFKPFQKGLSLIYRARSFLMSYTRLLPTQWPSQTIFLPEVRKDVVRNRSA